MIMVVVMIMTTLVVMIVVMIMTTLMVMMMITITKYKNEFNASFSFSNSIFQFLIHSLTFTHSPD